MKGRLMFESNKKKDYYIQMRMEDGTIKKITHPHTQRVTKTSLIRLKRVLPNLEIVRVKKRGG